MKYLLITLTTSVSLGCTTTQPPEPTESKVPRQWAYYKYFTFLCFALFVVFSYNNFMKASTGSAGLV